MDLSKSLNCLTCASCNVILLAVISLACDRLRGNGERLPPPTVPSSQPMGWAARASCDVPVCLVLIIASSDGTCGTGVA